LKLYIGRPGNIVGPNGMRIQGHGGSALGVISNQQPVLGNAIIGYS